MKWLLFVLIWHFMITSESERLLFMRLSVSFVNSFIICFIFFLLEFGPFLKPWYKVFT